MATTLYCPNCSNSLGKETENTVHITCDHCGTSFFNQYGYIVDQVHYRDVKEKYPDQRLPLPDND